MLGNEEVQGIYILAASEIFTKLHNESHGKGLGLWISFYEIYCGQLFDLLNGRAKYVCFGHPEKYNLVYTGDLEKMITQGAKKVIFTACHSGKLKLAFTSPNVTSTSPQNVFNEQN